MRPGILFLSISVACAAADPAERESALTREQVAVFVAVLEEATPVALEQVVQRDARRRLKTELTALKRALERAPPSELLSQIASVQAVGGQAVHPAIALVLREAEAAALSKRPYPHEEVVMKRGTGSP